MTTDSGRVQVKGQKVLGIVDIVFAGFGLLWAVFLAVAGVVVISEYPGVASRWGGPAPVWTMAALALLLAALLLLAGIGLVCRAKWGGVFALVYGFARLLHWLASLVIGVLAIVQSGDINEVIVGAVVLIVLSLFGLILPVFNLIIGFRVLGGQAPIQVPPQPGGPDVGGRHGGEEDLRRVVEEQTSTYTQTSERISVQEIRNNTIVREHKLVALDPFGAPVRNFVGRDPSCQVVITGDAFVSGRHCVLTRDTHGNNTVADAGSAHGTYLVRDRLKIAVTSATPVFSGDTIVLGNTKLLIHFVSSN